MGCEDITALVQGVFPRLFSMGNTSVIREAIADIGEVAYILSRTGNNRTNLEALEPLRNLFSHAERIGFQRDASLRLARTRGAVRRAHSEAMQRGEIPGHSPVPAHGMPDRPFPQYVAEVASDLAVISGRIDRGSLLRLIEDMSVSTSRVKGGRGVLSLLNRLGFPAGTRLEVNITGSVTRRVYDIVLQGNSSRSILIEVKNWSRVTGLRATQWQGAADQLLRDFQRARPDDVYWIFQTQARNIERQRNHIRVNLMQGINDVLFRQRRLRNFETIIQMLRNIQNLEDLQRIVHARFVPLFIDQNGQPARNTIDAMESFFRESIFRRQVFINPG